MKKKNNSIQNQLLINLLIPSIVLLMSVFYIFYSIDANKLQAKSVENRKNIIAETKSLIQFYDHSMREHEKDLIGRMRMISFQLQAEFSTKTQLEKVDLFSLSKKLKIDTANEHIYIIDKTTEVVNTTFQKDLGLKFTDFGPTMYDFFTNIRLNSEFKEDRFGLESRTGKIKKYSFLPSLDHRYIIELGFYSTQANGYKNLLVKKISEMGNRYEGIHSPQLHLSVKNGGAREHHSPKVSKAYLTCLRTHKNQVVINDDPSTIAIEKVEFIFLPVLKSSLYEGYILELNTDNSEEQKLFQSLLFNFLLIGTLSAVIFILIIVWRTRKIAKPIKDLSLQTQAIDSHNLDTKISISGSQEINDLGNSFNSMIHKLKESYESLEEKVEQRTEELRVKEQILRHKNQEITESIHYAKFIQEALLPSEIQIKQIIPNSFIYFQPKDIIAGDFYWYAEKNNYSFIAVADCTGHGVPGAMVSVLCINSLNEALTLSTNLSTGEILDLTRELVIKKLTKEDRSLKDGMDISLIRIDHSTKTIQWSGANNPLWIFNADNCIVLSPDKQPIGHSESKIPFQSHEYQFQENDLFILFSDGFADQFGGPKDKKFKYSTFKELIIQNQHLALHEMKVLLEKSFIDWKGSTEQTDDVCVIGFRM